MFPLMKISMHFLHIDASQQPAYDNIPEEQILKRIFVPTLLGKMSQTYNSLVPSNSYNPRLSILYVCQPHAMGISPLSSYLLPLVA